MFYFLSQKSNSNHFHSLRQKRRKQRVHRRFLHEVQKTRLMRHLRPCYPTDAIEEQVKTDSRTGKERKCDLETEKDATISEDVREEGRTRNVERSLMVSKPWMPTWRVIQNHCYNKRQCSRTTNFRLDQAVREEQSKI